MQQVQLVSPVQALGQPTQDGDDIVDIAAGNEDFSTLVAAVSAAGLVDTLKGDGPFTVFAPSDAAFAQLPEGTVEALLKDKEQLKAILTYHVVPGKFTAEKVVERYRRQPGSSRDLGSDSVAAMYEDRDGRFWVGTGGGLCRLLDDERFETLIVDGEKLTPYILELFEDALEVCAGPIHLVHEG